MKSLVKTLVNTYEDCDTGSTLSLAYIPADEKNIIVAVLGDSPVMISQNHTVTIAPIFNVSDHEQDRNDLINRGVEVRGAYQFEMPFSEDLSVGLQLTRCLGDKKFKRQLKTCMT